MLIGKPGFGDGISRKIGILHFDFLQAQKIRFQRIGDFFRASIRKRTELMF